jgi:hypothetical protein
MRWAGHVSCREMRNVHKILYGKPERKRPLTRHSRGHNDNTKMNLKDISWEDLERIHLAQDRIQWQHSMSVVMKFRVL